MLPQKIRRNEIQRKILRPEGAERWQAPTVARGIIRTALKWAEGQDEITLDDIDVNLLRAAGNELRDARPIVGWNPFRPKFCGHITTISAKLFHYLLTGEGI